LRGLLTRGAKLGGQLIGAVRRINHRPQHADHVENLLEAALIEGVDIDAVPDKCSDDFGLQVGEAEDLSRSRGPVPGARGEAKGDSPAHGWASPHGNFLTAIVIARTQKAKSWELRAATSLARLRREQGRPAEAHDPLAPVYGWFAEGFDTLDLTEAKALLDELTEPAIAAEG
jgi:hypothetical protein